MGVGRGGESGKKRDEWLNKEEEKKKGGGCE